jgi:hypothetical protein
MSGARRQLTSVPESGIIDQYYDQAVRDLIAAEKLVPNVKDWVGYPSRETYRQQVATEHRQKRAFWKRMEGAGLSRRR